MKQAETTKNGRTPATTRRRITSDDAIVAREFLTLAIQTIEPDGQTQRRLFAALMPDLFVLRKKGCSFAQLTSLLNQIGFGLQPTTVRNYYYELLADKMELCEGRWDEQLVMLAQVDKITRGTEISSVAAKAAKVASVKENRRAALAPKVDELLARNVPTANAGVPAQKTAVAQTTAPVSKKAAPPSAATGTQAAGPVEGDFGLLASSAADTKINVRPGAGFFIVDEEAPQVPNMSELRAAPQATPAADNHNAPASAEPANLRCAPLQTGIDPIERRDGIPDVVFTEVALEHPALPGLLLSREQRLYGALLEIIDEHGVVRKESLDEKRFRMKWKPPFPAAQTGSRKNFVPMHADTFSKETSGK